MDWYELLPLDLKKAAYSAKNGFVISAVDVWIPTTPGPAPYGYDWAPSRAALLGIDTAVEFVQSFDWKKSDAVKIEMQPYFNIWAMRRTPGDG
jgi:hypothetical protein